MRAGGHLAEAAADRGQPVAASIPARRSDRARSLHTGRHWACGKPARAGNHRERPDRRFRARQEILGGLKSLGVRIALDDFGTGFSSLSYLQSFPFDKIKIDRSFVSNLPSNERSASIVRSIIALGHGFKVPILAEGVETEEQFAFLAAEACDEVQGYLLGRPSPLQDYADLMNQRRASVVPAKRARTDRPSTRRIRG